MLEEKSKTPNMIETRNITFENLTVPNSNTTNTKQCINDFVYFFLELVFVLIVILCSK